ncbi:Origin recognition complex, subunit 1 [Phlyctochytrium planicorne]|nr:Origin recognition complex, subunit 1 [Phlyctochytrium planicorne]
MPVHLPSSDVEIGRVEAMLATSPEDLPGRESEFEQIYSFLTEAVEQRQGECIYVSGVPGTGKTATLRSVIKTMRESGEGDFDYFEINCMKLVDPSHAYVELLKHVDPKSSKVGAKKAAELLSAFFKKKTNAKAAPKKPIILLLDELDMLVTKTQSVIYNFLDWPRRPGSPLIVVGIANTMDLPERVFTQKINSRVGSKRVPFKAYSVEELMRIIQSRTGHSPLFQKDAIEFCARKVAGISGDARRALDICQ